MTSYFMQVVATGWLVYDLTDSATWLGISSFTRGIPMLVLALPAGVLVDRMDRRTVLWTAQALMALTGFLLAALIATGLIEAWHVAFFAFVGGCLFVLIIPARQALTGATVPRPLLGRAVALMSIGQNSGRVIGPVLAGLMLAIVGTATSFFAQAAGFLLAGFTALAMPRQPPSASTREKSALQNLVEGVRYVWTDPAVRGLFSLQAIPAVMLMPYTQLLPIFTRDILHTGPEGLGVMMTVMGVGAIVGSFVVVALPSRRLGIWLFGSVGLFGAMLVAFAFSESYALSLAIMALVGIAQSVYLSTNNTLVQLQTPDELRGRVMSVYMTTWGLMPLGALPQGVVAEWFGAPFALAVSGLVGCAFVILMAVRAPEIRRL
jgi:MFS family permease